MLRRCLGQQGDIRLSLYIGLMSLVESSPALVPVVFEILQAHVSICLGGEMFGAWIACLNLVFLLDQIVCPLFRQDWNETGPAEAG